TTAEILTSLRGTPVEYVVSDVSPFFLAEARARLGAETGIRYALYDADRDFRAQGFTANSFHVIVASDVLHATADIGETIARLRALLAPGGVLVVAEMTRDHQQIMTSLEFLARHRRPRTFWSREEWVSCLRNADGELLLDLPGETADIL